MELDKLESKIPLPNELLSKIIIKFVPMCHWSSCLEYVSKQFQSCVSIAYGQIKCIDFRKLFSLSREIKNWEAFPNVVYFAGGKQPGRRETLLFWEDAATLSARLNNILMKLLWVCPNLADISGFEYITRTVDFETWNILMEFENLQSITLAGLPDKIPFEFFADFVANCKSLKTMNVYSCDFDVENRILNVGSLTNVSICEWYSKKTTFIENISEKLTSLTLKSFGCAFKSPDAAIHAMRMCTNLDSLSVGIYIWNDFQIFFHTLPNLCKLTKLRLTGSISKSFPYDDRFCVQLDALKNQLQFVDFQSILLDDVVIDFFLTKCPNLESLKFDGLSKFTTKVLENVPNLPANLTKLTFSTSRQQILPILLPKLTQLSNFTSLTVNSYGVDSVSENFENIYCLPNLQNLRLHGAWVTEALLEKWDEKNDKMLEKLISLEIPYCRHITDIGGGLLAKKTINLQILDLSMSRITEKTIFTLAYKAKKLRAVNFSQREPFLFDEDAILFFIKKATDLKKLDIEQKLARKVVEHNDFQQFVENIEIVA